QDQPLLGVHLDTGHASFSPGRRSVPAAGSAPELLRARAAACAAAEPARRRSTQPSTLRCGARLTARAPGGTSVVTTEPAAVYAPSPTLTGATSIVSLPTRTPSPTTVRCLATPS